MSLAEVPPLRTRGEASIRRRLDFAEALSRLSAAAEQSQLVLFAEASIVLKELLAAESLRILVHSGGVWRDWERLDTSEDDGEDIAAAAPALDRIVETEHGLLVPVRSDSVALIVRAPGFPGAIDTAVALLRLALAASAGTHGNPDKLEAIRVFQRVAGRILKSQDLQEVLLLITHEAKNRLAADISGVMLLEGSELVMQRCVGNLSIDTATLRMRRGQGVAGRVLQTREPCSVEDYLRSDLISRDFFSLARSERVRSALAAPILSKDEVLGVLEVWRRRPSTFTCQHTAELVTLASLASIAIETVSLASARERMVRDLAATNQALRARCDAIQRSASLQEGLARTLLQGEELPGIAAQASATLDAPVLLLDPQLHLIAAAPRDICNAELERRIRSIVRRGIPTETRLTTHRDRDEVIAFQSIMAGADHFGWAVVIGKGEADESLPLAVAQVCTMAALCNVKQRAAARARSDKLESVLWDVLEGPDSVRRLAVERAGDLDIVLSNRLVAICIGIGGLDADGLTATEIERRRRLVAQAPLQVSDAAAFVRLSGLRGDTLGIVCDDRPAGVLETFAETLADKLLQLSPQLAVHVGISTPVADPMALVAACREARIASAVARQRGRVGVISYGAVGIAGLLMGARDDEDFRRFVAGTLGPILREKNPHREVLLNTLRVFFAENCSRQASAKHLRIHQKTISYRLDKIARLTGLDLAKHEDRVLTDLALRMQTIVA